MNVAYNFGTGKYLSSTVLWIYDVIDIMIAKSGHGISYMNQVWPFWSLGILSQYNIQPIWANLRISNHQKQSLPVGPVGGDSLLGWSLKIVVSWHGISWWDVMGNNGLATYHVLFSMIMQRSKFYNHNRDALGTKHIICASHTLLLYRNSDRHFKASVLWCIPNNLQRQRTSICGCDILQEALQGIPGFKRGHQAAPIVTN